MWGLCLRHTHFSALSASAPLSLSSPADKCSYGTCTGVKHEEAGLSFKAETKNATTVLLKIRSGEGRKTGQPAAIHKEGGSFPRQVVFP